MLVKMEKNFRRQFPHVVQHVTQEITANVDKTDNIVRGEKVTSFMAIPTTIAFRSLT